MPSLGDLIVRIGANIDDFKKGVNEATEDIHHFAETAEHLVQFGENLAITEALKEFGVEALTAFGNIQKVTIALKAMGGEAEDVERTIEGLKELAISDALSFPALVQAQQRMTAFGISADKIPGAMRAIADAAGATNRDFDSVAASFEKMALSGNASTKALVGVGISTKDLAEVMGVADKEVKTVFKDFLDESERAQALTEALQKLEGVSKEVAQGLLGQWQNVKTQIDFVFEDIGKGLEPVISQLLAIVNTDILPFVRSLAEGFNELPVPVKTVAVAVALLAAAIPPLAVAIGGLGLALPALGAGLATAGTAALAAAPYIAAFVAVVALLEFTGVIDAVKELGSALRNSFSGIVDLLKPIAETSGVVARALETIGLKAPNLETLKGFIELALPGLRLLKEGLLLAAAAAEYLSGHYKSMDAAAKAVIDSQGYLKAAIQAGEEGLKIHIKTTAETVKENMALAKAMAAAAEAARRLGQAFADANLAVKLELKTAIQDLALIQKQMDAGKLSARQFAEAWINLSTAIERTKQWNVTPIKQIELDLADALVVLKDFAGFLPSVGTTNTIQRLVDQFYQLPLAAGNAERSMEAFKQSLDQLQAGLKLSQLADAFKTLHLSVDEVSGAVQNKLVKAFETVAEDGTTSIQAVEAAWASASGAVHKLAQTDLPGAIKAFDDLILRETKAGAAIGRIMQLEEQRLQLVIQEKTLAGQSADAEIIALEKKRIAMQALIDASTNLGNVYVGLRKDFNNAFDSLTKGIADNIVEWKNWEDVLTNIGKSLAKNLLETMLEGFLKPLKNYLNKDGGLFDSLSKALTKGVGAATGSGGATGGAGGLLGALGLGKKAGGGAPVGLPEFDPVTGEAVSGFGAPLGGGGSAGGGLGSSLMGLMGGNPIGLAVDVAKGIATGLQLAHIESDVAKIEISTRQCKEQLVGGIQPTLNTYLPNLLHLVDIWDALVNGPLQDIDDMLRYGSIHVTTDMSDIIPAPGSTPKGQQANNAQPVGGETAGTSFTQDMAFHDVAADVKSISRNLLNPPTIGGQATQWNTATFQGAANQAVLNLQKAGILPTEAHQSTFDERAAALLASWKETEAAGGQVQGVGSRSYNPVTDIAKMLGVSLKQAMQIFDAGAAKQPAEWRAKIDPNIRKFNEGLINSEELLKLQAEAIQRDTDLMQDPAHQAAAAQAAALADAQKGLIPTVTDYQQAQRDLAASTRGLQQQVDALQHSFYAGNQSPAAAAALTAQVNGMGSSVALQAGFVSTGDNRGPSIDSKNQAVNQYAAQLQALAAQRAQQAAEAMQNAQDMALIQFSKSFAQWTKDYDVVMDKVDPSKMFVDASGNIFGTRKDDPTHSASFKKLGNYVDLYNKYIDGRDQRSFASDPIDYNQSLANYANNLNTQWTTAALPGQRGLPMGANALSGQWNQLALSSRDLSGVNGGSIPSSSSVPFFSSGGGSSQKADVYVTAVNPDGRTIVRGINEGLREIGVKL